MESRIIKEMSNVYLSVIIPFFNEESNLEKLHQLLMETLVRINNKCEIIYVNDASTDHSLNNLINAVKGNKNKNISVKIISLRRNFGQTAAISAGIDQAEGEILSLLDADLQNDPSNLPKMISKIEEGFDAVVGWRKNRKDDVLRVLVSKIANDIVSKIFNSPFHDIGCSLKVVKAVFLKDIRIYGETHRVIPILLYWRGALVTEQIVDHKKRESGKSKYGYSRVIKLILDLVTIKFLNSYGTKPLYVFGTFGILSILASFFLMIIVLYHKIFLAVYVHRNPLFLIASFLILLGIQFLLMGLLAELIVRTYFESQKKTTYEIKSRKDY